VSVEVREAARVSVRHSCGHDEWHSLPLRAEPEAIIVALRAARCSECRRKDINGERD
jgi:hypothetical protein